MRKGKRREKEERGNMGRRKEMMNEQEGKSKGRGSEERGNIQKKIEREIPKRLHPHLK